MTEMPKTETTCKMCGSTFEYHVYENRPSRVFCSVKCSKDHVQKQSSPIIEKARYLWDVEGRTQRDIAKILGVSHNSIGGWCDRNNFTKRRPPDGVGNSLLGPEFSTDFAADWNADMTVEELRRKYKVGRVSIEKARIALGLDERALNKQSLAAMSSWSVKTSLAPLPSLQNAEPIPQAVSFSRADTCQYPLTDRQPWRFCDAPTDRGWVGAGLPSPYCAAHRKVCYTVQEIWRQERVDRAVLDNAKAA